MARKRARRRAAGANSSDVHGRLSNGSGANTPGPHENDAGVSVNIRQINAADEGVLYTHRITERRGSQSKSRLSQLIHRLKSKSHESTNSVHSLKSSNSKTSGIDRSPEQRPPPPQSDTLQGFRSTMSSHQQQYTIASKRKYRSKILNWFDKHHMNFVGYFTHSRGVDTHFYRPAALLYYYIDWTFGVGFTSVFLTFLIIYLVLCLLFGGLLLVAGNAEPHCIVASGESFGASTPDTKFSDAFALSWTTFTTVGYGMTYTSTASDLQDTKPHECSWVVFLCTVEAFMGLLYAGMGAAILFGKVNRVQSHANIIFSNAVCLQYEEMDDDLEDCSMKSDSSAPKNGHLVPEMEDEENHVHIDSVPQSLGENKFVDQFNGCPILKFQVVNELCNREGGELVDCIMKVVGIKFKGPQDRITHSQYVRVNLVDYEHPFLSRVWHGVHILDSTSPLLKDRTRQRIRDNNNSWPSNWFNPDVIRDKLEFHDLVVTVAGVSNVSAVTVHAYKRYKIGDVLTGYNFAPIVFRDVETGKLEVDLSMCDDVREQYGIQGEDLSNRQSAIKQDMMGSSDKFSSNIRIKRSKSTSELLISEQTEP